MENNNSRDKKSQDTQKDKKQIDKKNKNKARINEMRRKYFDYYDDVKTNIKEDWQISLFTFYRYAFQAICRRIIL